MPADSSPFALKPATNPSFICISVADGRRHPATCCRRLETSSPTAAQANGRRLLSDCDVLGSVGKGGSIAILLLVGFVLGGACSWLVFWWRQRRALRIEVGRQPRSLAFLLDKGCAPTLLHHAPQLEYRDRYGNAMQHGLPDVSAMVKVGGAGR